MSVPPQEDNPEDIRQGKAPEPKAVPKKKHNLSGSKKNRIDKLVMGAIIGVAVGSVVGIMKEKGHHKEEEKEPIVPQSRIGKALGNLFSGKKKKKQVLEKDMKKIPSEME